MLQRAGAPPPPPPPHNATGPRRGANTHTQASVPLGSPSHFPPFRQASLGWEHRRPGERQEERSAGQPQQGPTPGTSGHGAVGGRGPPEARPEPWRASSFRPESWGQKCGGGLAGGQVDRSRSRRSGVAWNAWRPAVETAGMSRAALPNFSLPPCPPWGPEPTARIILLFKQVLRGDGAQGGGWPHSAPPLVGKCDSCKARCPARQQSAGRGIRAAHCQARAPPGAPGLHPRDLAPPPQTPNSSSPGWASSAAAPSTPPRRGDEDAPFARNWTPLSGRGQLIKPLPLHLTRAGKLSSSPGGEGVCRSRVTRNPIFWKRRSHSPSNF